MFLSSCNALNVYWKYFPRTWNGEENKIRLKIRLTPYQESHHSLRGYEYRPMWKEVTVRHIYIVTKKQVIMDPTFPRLKQWIYTYIIFFVRLLILDSYWHYIHSLKSIAITYRKKNSVKIPVLYLLQNKWKCNSVTFYELIWEKL